MALSDRDIPMGREEDAEKPVLDDWLALRARKAGRDVGFLETSLEQWQSFAAIPMDDQIAMLRSAIDTYSDGRVRIARDRKSVVSGKRVSGRVGLGGGRIIKKKNSN